MSKKRIIVLICALVVMLAAIAVIIVYTVDREEAGDIYRELQDQVTIPPIDTKPVSTAPPTLPKDTQPAETTPPEPTEPPTQPTQPEEPYVSPIDFEPLWEINKDVYGWIDIPGMDVSYPLLQHPTDDTYYLEHTIEGKKKRPGTIYTEKWNSKDFSDRVTIVYGHNMHSNGTMFEPLKNYRDLTFMREHQIVSFYTPEGEYHYRIWAAVTYSNAYLPEAFDLTTQEGVGKFLEAIRSVHDLNSHIDNEVSFTDEDRFVVLSTCIYPDTNKAHRLLVVGVLDEELSKP